MKADVDVRTKCVSVELGSGVIEIHPPRYDGEYNITPAFREKVLPTADKTLSNNITVYSIPLYSAANPAGGNTVTIGETENYG